MTKTGEIFLNSDGLKEIHRMLFDLIYSKHGVEAEALTEIEPKFLILRLLRETGFQNPPPKFLGDTGSGYKYGAPRPKSLPNGFDQFEKTGLIDFFDAVINDRYRESGYIDVDHASGGVATKGNTAFKFFDRALIEKAFIWMQKNLEDKALTPTLPSPPTNTPNENSNQKKWIQERHKALCKGLGIDYDKYKKIPLGALIEEVLRQGRVVISKGPPSSRNPFLYDIDGKLLYTKDAAGERPTATLEKITSKAFNKDKIIKIISGKHIFHHHPLTSECEKLGKVIKENYKFTEQMFSPEFLKKWGISGVLQETTATSSDLPKPQPIISDSAKATSVEIHLANGFYPNPAINPRFANERRLLESRISPHFAKSHFTADEAKQISVSYVQKKDERGSHRAVAVLEVPASLAEKLEGFKERYYSGKGIFKR